MEWTVRTGSGDVRGRQLADGTHEFLGVPYGAPPVGARRFRPPVPCDTWRGVRDCTDYGPVCPQPGLLIDTPVDVAQLEASDLYHGEWRWRPGARVSEDCLHLNVQTPSLDGRLPVLVNVHGGRFNTGSNLGPVCDMRKLAREAVTVQPNYRLGPLGFLSLGEFGGHPGSPNCGMLDLVLALRWVQENIAAFGGDPERVTVFGISSGAAAVSTLLAMPNARGLFQRAIVQSGASYNGRAVASAAGWNKPTPEHAKRTCQRVCAALGVDPTDVARLERTPADDLIRAHMSLWQKPTNGEPVEPAVFYPVIDGSVITARIPVAVAAGCAGGVDLIVGLCRDEMQLFARPPENTNDDTIAAELAPLLETTQINVKDLLETYRSHHPRATPAELYRMLEEDVGWNGRQAHIRLAEAQLRNHPRVWMYRFDWPNPMSGSAYHGLDIPFTYGTIDRESVLESFGYTPGPQQLTEHIQRAWAAFARCGDPSANGVEWPRYDTEQRFTLLLNETTRVVADPDGWRRAATATLLP